MAPTIAGSRRERAAFRPFRPPQIRARFFDFPLDMPQRLRRCLWRICRQVAPGGLSAPSPVGLLPQGARTGKSFAQRNLSWAPFRVGPVAR